MKKFIYGILGFLFAVTIACAIKYGAIDVKGLTFNDGMYFQHSPSVTMVWKNDNEITVQAGKYYINGKILNLATNTDWSWTLLDTGSEATQTWYYLYAYDNSGAVGSVASLTYPTTSRWNTNLSGTTYDKNIYLGAFYNTFGSTIYEFTQIGNRFISHTNSVAETGTSLVAKSLDVPMTANICIGFFLLYRQAGGVQVTGVITAISTGARYQWQVTSYYVAGNAAEEPCFVLEIPLLTPQTIWLRVTTTTNSPNINFSVRGWIDKWL